MPVSFTYIKTNNCSPLETFRTPYGIILIIPCLVAIASNHRDLRAPYYGCIYILNYNVITQSQGTAILYFIFHMCMWYISYLVLLFPHLALLFWQFQPVNFIGAFSDLFVGSDARHTIYVFNRDGKLVSIAQSQL